MLYRVSAFFVETTSFFTPLKKERDFFMSKTSVCSNVLIWFGAGVSIAEILTGISVAPLGFFKGTLAILLGHTIGCLLLFLAGVIGGITEKNAMDTVKLSFGKKGAIIFSSLNVIQLVGWTSIMIASGASAAMSVYPIGQWVWCIVTGILIGIWVVAGTKRLDVLNTVAVATLFILTIILSVVVFGGGRAEIPSGNITFGTAVELSVAMPLSWLPLISDYTSRAKRPVVASAASSVTYFLVSCWMYIIGMCAALLTGESDVAIILSKAGLGVAALIIVIFSTVTTTYLDVFSAGESSKSIRSAINGKYVALAVTATGTVMAIFINVFEFESFLYFIGSVFAPMIAIQIVDYFILKRDSSANSFDLTSFGIWLVGFVIYRLFMKTDMVLGCTLPAMLVVGLVHIIVQKIKGAGR